MKRLNLYVCGALGLLWCATLQMQSSSDDIVQRLQDISQRLSAMRLNYAELASTNACQELRRHEDSIKPMPGRPMLDVSFEWELKRRQLHLRCEFENMLRKLQELESAVANLQAAQQGAKA